MAPDVSAIRVRKRSGRVVTFDENKIEAAIAAAFRDTGEAHDKSDPVKLARVVKKTAHAGDQDVVLDVEAVQDLVERVLMPTFPETAKAYILYRRDHARLRGAHVVSEEDRRALIEDARYFKCDAERFQHVDKYARFNETKGRRETFVESTDRVIGFLQWHVENRCPGARVSSEDWQRLRLALLHGEATPSMRLMQMAGPPAQRCNVSIYNCAFDGISDLTYFAENLYILMQGTGQGFSCESEFVEQLPRIKRRRDNAKPDVFEIADTTEGWCDSLKFGMERWYEGHDVKFVYDSIRPAGARLKTKGGTASGPGPLIELHDFTRRIILARQKRRLRDIDVHDISCFIGRIVQVGGVRRAAEISLSDLDSMAMRMAKFGAFYNDPAQQQRTMANNSAVYEEKPTAEQFMEEWLSLTKSKSGERGIFNRAGVWKQIPERRRRLYGRQSVAWGTNPCGEIILHPDGQFCNLSIAIVRPDDTEQDLLRKVELATVFGTIQSSMTSFRYLRPRWRENCERERLLGVDLLGALDCPLLRETNPDRNRLLGRLREKAVETNRIWAERLGINASMAVTCIKPGGNSSVRWGTGQSMSGWLTEHLIRNVEVSRLNPLCQFLIDAGVPHEASYRDPGTMVFSFPLQAPEGAHIQADIIAGPDGIPEGVRQRDSAIQQMENWMAFKEHYTEHNPSVSIYVADDEWLEVGNWVYRHWDMVGGLSFFPLDGGIYKQAPLQPVTAERFERFVSTFPAIPWEKLPRYEQVDHTEVGHELACTGGACFI